MTFYDLPIDPVPAVRGCYTVYDAEDPATTARVHAVPHWTCAEQVAAAAATAVQEAAAAGMVTPHVLATFNRRWPDGEVDDTIAAFDFPTAHSLIDAAADIADGICNIT